MMKHFCDFCGGEVLGNYQKSLPGSTIVHNKAAKVDIMVVILDPEGPPGFDGRKATCIDCMERAVTLTFAKERELRARAEATIKKLEGFGQTSEPA